MMGYTGVVVGDGHEPFADAFERIVAGGAAAALQVRRGPEVVVDLAANRDPRGVPFTSDTQVLLYSAVKPFTALAALLAAADGQLDLDEPVAWRWPEFGAHGKDRVTVREALAHGTAVPGWRTPLTLSELGDLPHTESLLAASVPWWEPGEPGEHAVSYGHVVDGILRHATGRGVWEWWPRVQEAVGISLSLLPSLAVAPLEDPGGIWRDHWSRAQGPMGDLLRNPAGLLDVELMASPLGRCVIAPAVTGYGSAAELATLWSWWAGAGAAVRLGTTLQDESLRPVLHGLDHVLGVEVAWGLGPQIEGDAAGMGGVGGCVGWVERDLDLTIAFTSARVLLPGELDPLDEAVMALRRGR